MELKRKLLIILIVLLCVFGVIAIPLIRHWQTERYRTRTRNEWKAAAIADINRFWNNPEWFVNEKAKLGTSPVDEYITDWFTQHLIVMKNGDWIICSAIARKSDWRIDDIFVGRASDGKWYYSTYHFCVDMCTLQMGEGRPENLNGFIKQFYLREFDGSPSTKLESTWPVWSEWERAK